jgi:hypothetical protein
LSSSFVKVLVGRPMSDQISLQLFGSVGSG